MKVYFGFGLHDIMLKRWVRQGVITKAWLGTGEEAVTIGTTRALTSGDYAGPMIRNAAVCCELGMSLGGHVPWLPGDRRFPYGWTRSARR